MELFMNELELEIARQLGASSFLVYSVLKNKGDLTRRDLEIECGMSEDGILRTVKKLEEDKIITRNGKINRSNLYTITDVLNWRIQ